MSNRYFLSYSEASAFAKQFAQQEGMTVSVRRENGQWLVELKRTYVQALSHYELIPTYEQLEEELRSEERK